MKQRLSPGDLKWDFGGKFILGIVIIIGLTMLVAMIMEMGG